MYCLHDPKKIFVQQLIFPGGLIILLLLSCEFDSLPADKPSLPETLISDRVKSVQAMMGQYCEICSECKVV